MKAPEISRLSDGGDSLGLRCDRRGLDLAGIPLLRREPDGFRPRSDGEIETLLASAYGMPVRGLQGGLQAVANALNEDNVPLALIAAVHLGLPPLDWDGGVNILRAERALAKHNYNPNEPRDWHGRWTTGDSGSPPDNPPHSGERSPQRHGGRLAPSHLSNPLFHPIQAEEDENGHGGLLGDFMDLPRQFRIELYQRLQSRLREVDPGNPQLESLRGPDYSPTQAHIDELVEALREAQEKAGEPPATTWELGWGARGIELELQHLNGVRTLPSNAPIIDAFRDGVAVSIKSIDLNATWYRNPTNLSNRIDRYVNKLVEFDGLKSARDRIPESEIKGRVLDIVVPKNSGTEAQIRAIRLSSERARRLGIHISVHRY